MFFLHCLRSVPRGVWMLILIVSLSSVVSWVVNSISSRPVSSGKFTSAELAAFNLPQREGTQPFMDLPSTGIVEQSPALHGDASRLLLSAPANASGTHFCTILTSSDESLKIFIRNGETADIRLAANTYALTLTWGTYWSDEEQRFQPLHEGNIPPLVRHLAKLTVLQITPLSNGEFVIMPTPK